MEWVGPYSFKELLENCISEGKNWPQPSNGLYLVTKHAWHGEPTKKAEALYVGSNTGESNRFVTRIGDLVADLFGFFCEDTGHHSGGIRLYEQYCKNENIHPFTLHLGWTNGGGCPRCLENELYDKLKPSYNKKRPPYCPDHKVLTRGGERCVKA
ncbi:MAG: hypothetical protein ACOZHQ_14295 [Thermodesulfobacteriota bacterium]